MSVVLPTPLNLQQRRGLLLGIGGWTAVIAAVLAITIGVPVLNLVVPDGSVFHISDYTVSLAGKILCYAICALAMDLIWATPASCRSGMACSSRSAATRWACT